jgi:hypothetical protein
VIGAPGGEVSVRGCVLAFARVRQRTVEALVAVALLVAGSASGRAQEPAPPLAPPPATTDRPGLFHWGPFWVTPRFRLGNIGLDTNVFYTSTDRQTDFYASGGPGLGILVPMKAARLILEGNVGYNYFARTRSQRRWTDGAKARLEVGRGRARAGIEENYTRTFERPSFEVDRRISTDTWTTRADFTLDFTQRTGIRAEASRQHVDIPRGQGFFGTDLGKTLSRDVNLAILGLLYHATAKTSLVLEGDYQQDRFRYQQDRDTESNRIYGGFEVQSQTRLSGRAVGGVRLFRPKNAAKWSDRRGPYVDVNLAYRFGPRTALTATYLRDVQFSAFEPTGSTPTVDREDYGGRFEKGFLGRGSLWLYGGISRFVTDGAVTVIDGEGNVVTAVRDDKAWHGGADLGYYLRPRLRIGVAATYTKRKSTFDDFGLKGLLVGGTVSYNPN